MTMLERIEKTMDKERDLLHLRNQVALPPNPRKRTDFVSAGGFALDSFGRMI